MTKATATFVREDQTNGRNWKLYRLFPPLPQGSPWFDNDGNEVPGPSYTYVVVSVADVPFSGPETFVFGSDGQDVVDWLELDHNEALRRAGYEVVS